MSPISSPAPNSGQAPPLPTPSVFDVKKIRADFPILSRQIRARPLVYFDNAATAQKPLAVMAAMNDFMCQHYASVHRGVHQLSQEATQAYEGARLRVARFLNAARAEEIIFVRGATEGINLVAHSWGGTNLRQGDEIILSQMEHHSNIIPWQLLQQRLGFTIKVAPLDAEGALDVSAFSRLLTPHTRLVSLTAQSNVLGTIVPIKEIAALTHSAGAILLVDACQAIAHAPMDVQEIGADFLVFSAHKLYGPTGIGVLYGRQALLADMPPYQGGGSMIRSVSFAGSSWALPPARFEAGTPAACEAIGLASALDYIEAIGWPALQAHENALYKMALEHIGAIKGIKIFAANAPKSALFSFSLKGVHPHDLGTLLDSAAIAIRAGHHCAEPLMDFLKVQATARISFGLYNQLEEIEILVEALQHAKEFF
jgi:cysteine desulfurase / selenocysteine lyase